MRPVRNNIYIYSNIFAPCFCPVYQIFMFFLG